MSGETELHDCQGKKKVNEMLNKKSCAVVLLALLIVFFSRLNVGYAAETPANTEEVLVFLRDVVQLDMTKYEAHLSISDAMPWTGGLTHTTGKYHVDSSGLGGTSIIDVIFAFWDKTLVSCSLYEVSQGPPIYSQQPTTDSSDAATGFLQRYQAYTGDAELEKMRSIVDTVNPAVNTTTTVDNVKLTVSVKPDKTRFVWSTTYNGTDYNKLILEFRSGHLFEFYDNRHFYTVGSTEVNISEEEAIRIALERVGNYSYLYNGTEIADFNIVTDQIRTKLQTMGKFTALELYPLWTIDLPLDEVYPGSVYYIEVRLWADTGEITDCTALGYGSDGGLSPEDSSTSQQTSADQSSMDTRPENDISPETAMYVAVVLAVVLIPIVLATTIYKRKRK